MLAALLVLAAPALPQGYPPAGSDWQLPLGITNLTSDLGPYRVNSMTVPIGAALRVTGHQPFIVIAEDFIHVEGMIDARGFPAKSVITIFLPFDLPMPGAIGGPAGGKGGMGHPGRGKIVVGGGRGSFSLFPEPPAGGLGGSGGETGFSPSIIALHRRGGGGGGGAFGPDSMGSGPGLRARPGAPGHPLAFGALSGAPLPAGGAAGGWAFQDGNPLNDFLGVKADPATGALVHGELTRLRGGAGGGGSGQSLASAFFAPGWVADGKWLRFFRSGGGGGGGGIVLLFAQRIEVTGSSARLLVDGGAGASGDIGYLGAAGGGGSGGLLILDATTIDLRGASADVLRARGGPGGEASAPGVPGAGGDGGPGLLQLHLADPATQLLLSPGTTLADLSAPDAHVLLPLHP